MKGKIESSFVQLGQMLYEIKSERHYESGWESWGEFLMDMRISQGMASKLMSIYETFVLQYKIKPALIAEAGGWTVVYDLLPLAKDKESAEQWIKDAANMTRSDVKKQAFSARKKKEPKECEHTYCKMCSKCHFIYE